MSPIVLKITNLRLPVGESEERLPEYCAKALGVVSSAITKLRILRKSLDVRNKSRLEYVYTAAVQVEDEQRLLARKGRTFDAYQDQRYQEPTPGQYVLSQRPLIVGAGPAGLLCAYQLARLGYQPLVLERGKGVRERTADVRAFDSGGPLDPESNYLFGEGGAGTFSDGKLTCRNTGPDTDRVLEILAECKGKASILYEARPHLGSNRLPAVVKALRQRIVEWGGEIRFGVRVEEILVQSARVVGVRTSEEVIAAEAIVLAIGHSARDTIEMLRRIGLEIVFKPFQMGVRIEQPQAVVTECQYGSSSQARLLGAADYTINVRVDDREVFSFCMCAGGYVMPSVSQEGYFCTNGMSRSFHDSPLANSGIVTTIDAKDLVDAGFGSDALAGVRYQQAIERTAYQATAGTYQAPIQWASDFISQRASSGALPSSYARGVQTRNLWDILPRTVSQWLAGALPAMDQKWRGQFLKDATLVGPESRGSCPIRMPRDPSTRESTNLAGLFPIGEGAGYAGGIVSAAVDGLRTANGIIGRYQPIRK